MVLNVVLESGKASGKCADNGMGKGNIHDSNFIYLLYNRLSSTSACTGTGTNTCEPNMPYNEAVDCLMSCLFWFSKQRVNSPALIAAI